MVALPFLPEDLSFFPQKGATISEEMECYSLPYGGLGFASHVLTYYTILCLWSARRPLWPFQKVKFTRIDLLLGILALMLTIGLSAFTLFRCKNTWQLLCIAVWKLSMSFLNGVTAVHAATQMMRVGFVTRSAVIWIAFYIPGMFAGMVGLMSLVERQITAQNGLRDFTISFYCIVGIGVIAGLCGLSWLYFFSDSSSSGEKALVVVFGFMVSLGIFSVLAAFYSDWALGIMTHNLLGLPSGDNSGLYWSYFIAKRLPMLSW